MTATTLAAAINLTPQARIVFNHLRSRGSISPLEAFGTYGITRLAARINDLKKKGILTHTELKRDASGKAYARYTLAA